MIKQKKERKQKASKNTVLTQYIKNYNKIDRVIDRMIILFTFAFYKGRRKELIKDYTTKINITLISQISGAPGTKPYGEMTVSFYFRISTCVVPLS